MYLTAVKTALKDLFNWESTSLISVAGLAIAFATVFFIYSRVSFESGYDSHHEKAGRIYRISGEILTAGSEARHAVLGPFMGRGLKEHFPVVEEFARLVPIRSTIILEREEAKFSIDEAYFVDPSLFHLFTIDFVHGDINSALTGPREVVINQSLSQQMFGTENPIGSTLKDGDDPLTVTGVIKDSPKNSHHKLNVLFSHPNPDFYPEDEPAVRVSEGYWMPSAYHFILLVPGADIGEITDHFEPFYDKYMSPFGEAINAAFNPLAIPLRDLHYSPHMNYDYPKGNRIYSRFLLLIALFVLLIAGINYSNLLVARNITRSKSVGIRKIIGAGKNDLYLQSLAGSLMGGFTLVSILLSLMGLVNLTSIILKRRTKEIGIRKVNGAKVWEVMAMLNFDFVKWVVIAFIVATPIAWFAMSRWLQSFAYRTELSWWIFALAGLIALVIALLTVSWQSWRAARRNPVEALRYE